jgi:hypothetical protein
VVLLCSLITPQSGHSWTGQNQPATQNTSCCNETQQFFWLFSHNNMNRERQNITEMIKYWSWNS